MKKIITLISSIFLAFQVNAQLTITADFEEYNLPLDSFYFNANGNDFVASGLMNFEYEWTQSQWGDYWSGGFTYSTMRDSTTAGYSNLYSAITAKGQNNSNTYVTGQQGARIHIPIAIQRQSPPLGFYVTNSTYTYLSMRDGDAFAKKFGGVSGNDPDWFKLTVKSSIGGMQNQDSVEVYLADFRSSDNTQDYILKTWQFVDISNLGMYDSLYFYLSSSDVGSFGMNTPAFFCLDNITTPFYSSINEEILENNKFKLLKNPVNENSTLVINSTESKIINIIVVDILGKIYLNESIEIHAGENKLNINCNSIKSGMYSFIISDLKSKTETIKFVKE
jgi:hypothetical protein